jgi:Domain of unknown function (DUF4326)
VTTPKRIQQRRTKGWRKPDGAISVGRPHKWGNPFEVGETPGVRTNAHGSAPISDVATRSARPASERSGCPSSLP